MRPVKVTVSAAGVSAPVVLDYRNNPENASLACVVSSGANLSYKVQFSNDDPFVDGFDPAAATVTWFDHATLNAQSTTQYGTMGTPARMVRLNLPVGTYTSGSVAMTVVQSGD